MKRAEEPEPRIRRAAAALWALVLTAGCAERHLRVESTPPGADVAVNGKEAGQTPVDVPFAHYGTFDVVVRHDGYASRALLHSVASPWYGQFPLDVVTDLVPPWGRDDEHRLDVTLDPLPPRTTAAELRDLRGEVEGARADATRVERDVKAALGQHSTAGRSGEGGNEE